MFAWALSAGFILSETENQFGSRKLALVGSKENAQPEVSQHAAFWGRVDAWWLLLLLRTSGRRPQTWRFLSTKHKAGVSCKRGHRSGAEVPESFGMALMPLLSSASSLCETTVQSPWI